MWGRLGAAKVWGPMFFVAAPHPAPFTLLPSPCPLHPAPPPCSRSSETDNNVASFMINLAVCNTVVPTLSEDGCVMYQVQAEGQGGGGEGVQPSQRTAALCTR